MKILRRLMLLLVCLSFVCGCIDRPQTVREGIAIGYTSVESLAGSVDVAQRDGYLTEAQCNSILDRLQSAQNLLIEAQRLEAASDEDKALVALKVAQAILREIDGELQR